jgi:hypothetical protein
VLVDELFRGDSEDDIIIDSFILQILIHDFVLKHHLPTTVQLNKESMTTITPFNPLHQEHPSGHPTDAILQFLCRQYKVSDPESVRTNSVKSKFDGYIEHFVERDILSIDLTHGKHLSSAEFFRNSKGVDQDYQRKLDIDDIDERCFLQASSRQNRMTPLIKLPRNPLIQAPHPHEHSPSSHRFQSHRILSYQATEQFSLKNSFSENIVNSRSSLVLIPLRVAISHGKRATVTVCTAYCRDPRNTCYGDV